MPKSNLPFMESLSAQLSASVALRGGCGGKSLFAYNAFEDWYAKGNRIPPDISVEVFDIEGQYADYATWSSDRVMKFQSLVYFMNTYGSGFPNARLVHHENSVG